MASLCFIGTESLELTGETIQEMLSYVRSACGSLVTIDCSGFYKKHKGLVLVIKNQRFYDEDEEVTCKKVLQAKILPMP